MDLTEIVEADGARYAIHGSYDDRFRPVVDAFEDDPETLLTDGRYTFIGTLVKTAVTRPQTQVETRSDQIDKIITHRLWGVPIFLALMWLVFQFTANVSAPYVDWVDGLVNGPAARVVVAVLGTLGLRGSWVESLLVNGVIGGVGSPRCLAFGF